MGIAEAGLRRKLLFLTAGMSVLSGGVAYAQTATKPTTDVLEEIVVSATTGTTIRGVAPTGSAVLNISRDELVTSPVRDAAEIIARLPQGSGLGAIEVPGGTNNPGRASGVNLRGLGGSATLILFDGHRLAGQGINTQVADPNQIPFAAIERVEVVTDGGFRRVRFRRRGRRGELHHAS